MQRHVTPVVRLFILCCLNESLTIKTPTSHDAQDCLTIHSSSSSYSVLDFLGEGGFGTIVSSMNLRTKEIVALKILKDSEFAQDAEHEAGD